MDTDYAMVHQLGARLLGWVALVAANIQTLPADLELAREGRQIATISETAKRDSALWQSVYPEYPAGEQKGPIKAGTEYAAGLWEGVSVAFGATNEATKKLQISVAADDWGDASQENIRAVLKSAAGELWRYCPHTHLPSILVEHTTTDPIALFDRRPDGTVVVRLNSRGRLWAQFSFQYAHEFAHVLAVQAEDGRPHWRTANHANQWFEESLCETASLFALERMAKSWTVSPPYPNWKSYATHLAEYAKEREQDPAHKLPAEIAFATWFHGQEPSLRTNAVQRAKNCIIASQLLPLLRASPQHWEAMTGLNLGARGKDEPFAQYLTEWRANSGPEHRAFIQEIAGLFGVRLDSPR